MGKDEDPEVTVWSSFPKRSLEALIRREVHYFTTIPLIHDDTALTSLVAKHRDSYYSDFMQTDYAWSLSSDIRFYAHLLYEGFLPICTEIGGGTGLYILQPKMHLERCVIDLAGFNPSKRKLKRAAGFYIMMNQDLGAVIAGCIKQHGLNWLYPPIQRLFWGLYNSSNNSSNNSGSGNSGNSGRSCSQNEGGAGLKHVALADGGAGSSPSLYFLETGELGKRLRVEENHAALKDTDYSAVNIVSFECYQQLASGEQKLVAGEVGCLVNKVYTSFTGYHEGSGTGSTQLVLLGIRLKEIGVCYWDLGQFHAYKVDLGARIYTRKQFLDTFLSHRSLE